MKTVYIGCRTTKKRNARGKGLSVYRIEDDGKWTLLQCLFTEDNPSFQCLDKSGRFLYSVHGDITKVTSYAIAEDGTLSYLNTLDIGGRNPVDITIDRNNRNLIVATLQGGTLYTISRNEDGSLGSVIAKFTYEGKEPGMVSTIHQCLWDTEQKHIIACAQGRVNGYGQMRALRYDPETGAFTETDRFMARTWDEPRHAAFHPNGRWLYMVEEKGNKILYFDYNSDTGRFKGLQELSTVPETVLDYSDASEVMVDPSGEYVIVSNRYTDSLAIYHIDRHTGYLKMSGFTGCLGKTPRYFCFGPNGKCYVANEDSDTVIEFDWNPANGTLTPTGNIINTGSPVCISFRPD